MYSFPFAVHGTPQDGYIVTWVGDATTGHAEWAPGGGSGGSDIATDIVEGFTVNDTGIPIEVMSLNVTNDAFKVNVTWLGITITPDNPSDTPNGSVTIEDQDGFNVSIDWGPIPPGDAVYVPFSMHSTPTVANASYTATVTIENATGPCGVTGEMFTIPTGATGP